MANDNMQMTECNETVAAHKAEADQLIPMLKRQVAETRSETRKWRHRCELLEMELLRMGWSQDKLSWLYHNEEHAMS